MYVVIQSFNSKCVVIWTVYSKFHVTCGGYDADSEGSYS